MRRVLLLSFAFPPDNWAAAARPGQLFDYLPQEGYEAVVVASSALGSAQEGESARRVPPERATATVSALATLGRAFTRYCSPYEDQMSWVPHAVSAATRLIRSEPVDAIFSTSPSLAAHFAALWLKGRFGLPWIADFQDPVCDNPSRVRRWFYPYDAITERTLLGYADRLTANTDTVAAAWRERYPQWSGKISILWNCFDPREEIGPAPPRARPHRVLAHVGELYGGRHPGHLLASLERLKVDPSAIRVRLVGPIAPDILSNHEPLFERMRTRGILEFENRLVPRQEASRETAEADYLILLDLNKQLTSFQVPSKLLSYVRVGKPIIAYTPLHSPVQRILARSGIAHVTIDPSAPEALNDQKVAEFLSIPATPRQASSWFRQTFDARAQARTVAGLLDELLEESSVASRRQTKSA